ncbi:hypothetical protein [Solibacillus sp. FSL H8-0538]|uniref:hypothetical protein n=1 Tax=Solibacillus sp. FSL H8-0538 TaxID=2921400 RepID=UPI0030F8C20D
MAEHYSFFDAVLLDDGVTYDREYNAQQFTKYFGALVTTGVMKGTGNMLAVSANGSNMVTKINTGIAFVEAKYYENDSFKELTHDTETLGNSRIDRVVIRLDLSTEARYVKAFIKKGVPTTSPVAPTLTQTPNLYEISLAQVKVIGGQTFISTNAVTDERGTDIICPYAGSNILPNFDDNALSEHMGKKASINEFGHVKIGTGINVNNGVISATPVQNATTSVKGIVLLTNDSSANTQDLVPTTIATYSIRNLALQAYNVVYSSTPNVGSSSIAQGTYASAFGSLSSARGTATLALGAFSKAEANMATALGYGVTALNSNEGIIGDPSFTNKWIVRGALSVTGTKNFEIPHPHPYKKHTHVIRHGAVESPTTGDTLYRYTVEAVNDNDVVEVILPDYFEHLNINVDVWVNPFKHFGRAYGEVMGDKLLVTCEKARVYKVLVIGTRNDDNVQDWYIKGVEREAGESWYGETYSFEVDEITEVTEFEEVLQ